ncbi:hypothetical protein X737_38725 [Mesorhizobium sp. L48C026A00]|nr:hypothetical protein X737_38725 [Mesorhizobium sp. L48C026A00]
MVAAEIGLAHVKLGGQIGNRFVGNLGRAGGKVSEGCEELQLHRQSEPRPGRLGVHKVNIGKREAPLTDQRLR